MRVDFQKRIYVRQSVSPARRVAFAGVVTALLLLLLYALYVLPTMRLSVLFVLSLLPVALAHERRFADALLSVIAAATLSGFLFPAQGAWLLYASFFGWYGIVREWVVTRVKPIAAWAILAGIFNLVLLALYFLSREVLFTFVQVPIGWLIPLLEVAFVAYELLFGLCREYYLRNLRRHLFKF